MSTLEKSIQDAVSNGDLLEVSASNLRELLNTSTSESDRASLVELVDGGEWTELNDRFFKKLSFGTSGLRGRTIGKVVTKAENGTPTDAGRPERPCVGTNAMNYYNLSRATQGLVRYLKKWADENDVEGRPKVVFAHDTRHFSREFAVFCAGIVTDHGCDAFLFDSHRPTPELSFAVRYLNAHAGIMHTASHNPPHDNGYKVYWDDGGSIVGPVPPGIIAEVEEVTSDQYDALPEGERGSLTIIGDEIDAAYLEKLETVLLQPDLLQKAGGLKIVFTAIHGTGGVHVPTVLEKLGFQFLTVPEQDVPDGRFPTVKSPNPENAAALQMALDLAEKEGADIVMGTDPDCDRLGVAARDKDGTMTLVTGNQIGSLMAWYRTKTFIDQGIINDGNRAHAAIVKTMVTTQLQSAVAEAFGVRMVETLTGFKYIGAKQTQYEKRLPADVQARYRKLSTEEARDVQLKEGMFFIFGGEESYGYLGGDFIRDKDGNCAVVMFAELAALASSRGITVIELLDEVYREFGYFEERQKSIQFEGAEGADQMKSLVDSYAGNPPAEIDGSPVTRVRNFAADDHHDSDGDLIPRENMLILDLADGRAVACRPSGTEPKMKFYIFGQQRPVGGSTFSSDELAAAKSSVSAALDSLEKWIDVDRGQRLNPA